MSEYVPDRGDLIWLDFDPSAGTEIQKRRPALVLSPEIFNRMTGYAMVVPVTSSVRGHPFEVPLVETETLGVCVCQQARTLAFRVRKAVFIEKAPAPVVTKALALVRAILE